MTTLDNIKMHVGQLEVSNTESSFHIAEINVLLDALEPPVEPPVEPPIDPPIEPPVIGVTRYTHPIKQLVFPDWSLASYAHGKHTGPDGSPVLIDSNAEFADMTGLRVRNSSWKLGGYTGQWGEFAEGVVSINTFKEVTAPLNGGASWNKDANYQIYLNLEIGMRFEYQSRSWEGGTVVLDRVGAIEMVGDTTIEHHFYMRIDDGAGVPLSDWFVRPTKIEQIL